MKPRRWSRFTSGCADTSGNQLRLTARKQQGRPRAALLFMDICGPAVYLLMPERAAQLWIMPLPEPVIAPAFFRSLVTAATQLENLP